METIATGVALAMILGLGGLAWGWASARRDRQAVVQWLRANTRDEPGEAHVGTIEIAKGAGLTEDRTRKACLSDPRVYRASGESDQWSVWRKEPQSIYEKRGMLFI